VVILELEMPRRKGAVRGRESRNQTLTTKLTPTESAAVEAASEAEGKTVGEWLRDLALQTLRQRADASEVLLTEVVGLRLFLNNILKSMTTGEKLTPEAFAALLDNVKAHKREVARDLLQSLKNESRLIHADDTMGS
jgi:CRISPR/Cas system-associated protein Csx1